MVGGPGTNDGRYSWTGRLPSGKSGKHIIYSVWSRSDSTETFYGCSDVTFDGGHGEVTGVGVGTTTLPTTPPVTTPPTTTPPPASSGCTAMYNVSGAWGGGFQGEVMVHAGTTPVNGWTVSFTFPGSQTVTQVWSGKGTSSGSLVSVKNESWNGSIAANNYTTFGFLGSGTAPTTVQNLTCTSP